MTDLRPLSKLKQLVTPAVHVVGALCKVLYLTRVNPH